MLSHFSELLDKISLLHLNALFLLGLALSLGTIGGRLFQKFKIPQVVGYIVIGILLGASGLDIVDIKLVESLIPFNYFALGLIAFVIGGELKKEVFKKYGKQFIYTLFSEALGAFVIVTVFIGVIGTIFLEDARLAWILGLLLGTIASATDAASTLTVFKEYKTRGPLTTTTLGLVAMDDALAFILFAVIATFISGLAGGHDLPLTKTIFAIIYEIGGSILIGAISGLILARILKHHKEEDRILAFSIGIVLLVLGLSLAIRMDMLIAAMTLGAVLVNVAPRKSKEIFGLVERFTPPIFVLFFVLVGTTLNVRAVPFLALILVVCYLAGRTLGKTFGARLGTKISNSPSTVKKYLPLCLFSQASAAIGLAILASQKFPGEIGSVIVVTVTVSTFVMQLLGPSFVKLACQKAQEVGLNITEDDFIKTVKVEELMDKNPPVIYKNTSLEGILQVFGSHPNLFYPVVDKDMVLEGIITVDSIKNTLLETELSSLYVAEDLKEEIMASIKPTATMEEAKELFERYNLEYLPVVDNQKLVGFIELRTVQKYISTRLIELQEKADLLAQST
jgi:Kef-type K+ transport system membrane component KefB/predicted transcriptional regulator